MKSVLVEVIKSTKNATVDSDIQPLCVHQPDLKTVAPRKVLIIFKQILSAKTRGTP